MCVAVCRCVDAHVTCVIQMNPSWRECVRACVFVYENTCTHILVHKDPHIGPYYTHTHTHTHTLQLPNQPALLWPSLKPQDASACSTLCGGGGGGGGGGTLSYDKWIIDMHGLCNVRLEIAFLSWWADNVDWREFLISVNITCHYTFGPNLARDLSYPDWFRGNLT